MQVPRGRFLLNKCEKNFKYIAKEYPGSKRSFTNQQEESTLDTLIIVSRSQEVVFLSTSVNQL